MRVDQRNSCGQLVLCTYFVSCDQIFLKLQYTLIVGRVIARVWQLKRDDTAPDCGDERSELRELLSTERLVEAVNIAMRIRLNELQDRAVKLVTGVIARVLAEQLVKHKLLAVFVQLDFFVIAPPCPACAWLASFVVRYEDMVAVDVDEVKRAGQAGAAQRDPLRCEAKLSFLRRREAVVFGVQEFAKRIGAALSVVVEFVYAEALVV